MNDAAGMCGIQGVTDLDPNRKQLVERDRLPSNDVAEYVPLEQLHGKELQLFVLADLVNSADVRVTEARRHARLVLKTQHRRAIARELRRQELQRDPAAERQIFGLVDHSCGTFANLGKDAVVRDGLIDHENPPRLSTTVSDKSSKLAWNVS